MALSGSGSSSGVEPATGRQLRLFVVAGEHSGDRLGGKLIEALARRGDRSLVLSGVGAEDMAAQGLKSIFPVSDVAVMGPVAIAKRLPHIIRRVHETVDAAVAFRPDIVVIIDSPEFTHPIAKRIRKRMPGVPILDYVSPSVWAWRPGRARKMKRYVDHVLALLPFEPDVHVRLGGPECTYVGHPLIERLDWIRETDSAGLARRLALDPARPVLVVLPGSRRSEVEQHMAPFGEALRLFASGKALPHVLMPVVPSVRELVENNMADWPVRPFILEGDADKFAAFRLAEAALAASGTVTLELAVAGCPMVVAYKVDRVAALLRFLVRVHSIVLANLVLGENVFPEFVQEECTPANLAGALGRIVKGGEGREAQLEGLSRIEEHLLLPSGTPSEAAADVVLRYANAVR